MKETVSEIIDLDDQRLDATVRNDIAKMAAILGDDFEFFQGDGGYRNREQVLEDMQTGRLSYSAINPADTRVIVNGDMAVLFRNLRILVQVSGSDVDECRAATCVYIRRSSEWQARAYKGVMLPDKSVPLSPKS